MRRGAVRIHLGAGTVVQAPQSGVHLGIGQTGPTALRLFRSSGTRIVLACGVLPAQLIAIRAAACGAAVQVLSARPQTWEPLLRHGADASIVAPGAVLPAHGGPTLMIDDRQADARGTAEARPWQCRLDIRTHWTPSELATFTHADVVVLGAIPMELTDTLASLFGVAAQTTAHLPALAAGTFALVRRGRLQFVSLDPTPAENQVLALAL